ncbi:MAG: hypothetical protein ABIS14_01400 [Sphingomonas sp.]
MSAVLAIRVGCDGKTPYLSWERASKAMSRGRFYDRHGRGDMNVYRCRFCHSWHIGRSS